MVVHTTRYTTPSKSSPSSSRPIWTRYWRVASTEILYSASRILSVRLIVAPGEHRLDHVLDGRVLDREGDDGNFRQQTGGHLRDQVRQIAVEQDAAVVDHDHPLAQPHNGGHVVAGEQHRGALALVVLGE